MVTRKAAYCWRLSWILLLNIFQTNVEAGLTKRSGRMAREVYPEIEPENDANQAQVCIVGDLVYAIDELVPAEQPCLKCRCQPPGVQCETIKCIKKSGCKAIHRPNKCCPDYQCECHHEGKIYANGERLKTPSGGECKVCYCRGGEVQCAEVSCYIRTDCEGKTVPGQCCPKYDHCPPKEPLLGRPTVTTDSSSPNVNQEVLELWPLTKLLQNSSEGSTSPTLYETQDANKIENESATVENTIKITRATQTDFTDDTIKQIEQPKITIQEIIPEIKEIPITAPTHHLVIEDAKDAIGNNNDLVITDSEPDSSEISEVFQQPPPVLRIGDKLLFLKQGELVPEKDASTPTSVITIIGAEGLQRGFEDSAEFHEVPTKIYEDDSEHSLFNNSNDLEPKASESIHILSLVKKKSIVTSSTTEKNIVTTTSSDDVTTEESTTTIINATDTSILNATEWIDVTTSPSSLEVSTIIDQEETIHNNTTLIVENPEKTNDDRIIEINPAYPSIPEVMSPEHFYGNDSQLMNVKRTSEKELEISEILVTEMAPLPNVSSSNTVENVTTETEVDITTTEETSTIPTTSTEPEEASASTEYEKSMESIEETTEDSGESTSSKNDHASIVSDENASVEPSDTNLESDDMLKEVTPTPDLARDDVEMITNKTEEKESTIPIVKDVEMINVDNFTNLESDIIKSEKIELPVKTVEKRENSPQDQADEIFRELEAELSADRTETTQSPEEEKEESEKIFQELLQETSTPRSVKKGDKDAETLEKVTDAIAKLTLRGRKNSFDANILGVISNFFGSQHRYDRRK